MRRSQQDSFRALKERLRRVTLTKLYKEGYIAKHHLLTQYAGKPLGYTPQMDYINIRTDEGPTGVLHILFFGDFLPQSWIKDTWYELTRGPANQHISGCVRTRRMMRNDSRGIAWISTVRGRVSIFVFLILSAGCILGLCGIIRF